MRYPLLASNALQSEPREESSLTGHARAAALKLQAGLVLDRADPTVAAQLQNALVVIAHLNAQLASLAPSSIDEEPSSTDAAVEPAHVAPNAATATTNAAEATAAATCAIESAVAILPVGRLVRRLHAMNASLVLLTIDQS